MGAHRGRQLGSEEVTVIDAMAREEARARVKRAHTALISVVDHLPIVDGDTCMATAELDAALSELRVAKRVLDDLDAEPSD
jgi:hypothetical protein